MMDDMADHILKSRYLLPGEKDFTDICRRVAGWIGRDEAESGAFFRMMESGEFLPNSPALMNAGTPCNQLAGCFVIPVGNTITGIFEAVKQGAIIQMTGGGTGYNFSEIAPAGTTAEPGGAISPGPVAFLSVFDTVSEVIRQGGRRRGANMGILDIRHPDILAFIDAKDKEGKLSHFNLSVTVPDAVMEAFEGGEREEILSIHPATGRENTIGSVFDAIINGIHRNGEPGLLFSDAINRENRTPHLGEITATNPCGEEPLLPFEACILGSINLARFIEESTLDWKRLERTVRLAVRFLDLAIDRSSYPLPENEDAVKKTRKIGLGVMGLHDALILLGLPYDSPSARECAEEMMAFISETAVDESKRLAEVFGPFPAWEGSVWEKPVRNATLTTIAPTGTISLFAGCSPGIEPVYSFAFWRNNTAGAEFEVIHPLFSARLDEEIASLGYHGDEGRARQKAVIEEVRRCGSLQHIGWLSFEFRKLFVSALDISWRDHLLMQAAFQRHTHASIAKTINLPHTTGHEAIREAILSAWKLSLKGITLYRTGSRRASVYSLTGCRGCEREIPYDATE